MNAECVCVCRAIVVCIYINIIIYAYTYVIHNPILWSIGAKETRRAKKKETNIIRILVII